MERYLKIFTFVSNSDIAKLMIEHNANHGKRKAQHLLASEVLEMVHGVEEAVKTRSEHQMMRNPTLNPLSSQNLSTSGQKVFGQDTNRIILPRSQVLSTTVAHVLYHAGLAKSKSEGTRMIEKGGVYVALETDSAELNFTKIDTNSANDAAGLLVDNLLILRLGKWKVRVIEVVDIEPSQHETTTSACSNG